MPNLTPTNKGYFTMLWLIATESTDAKDRKWAENQIMEGFVSGMR